MTLIDAATTLGRNPAFLFSFLKEYQLPYETDPLNETVYFSHKTSKQIFPYTFAKDIIVFQVLKGGTGKTSLAYEFAIRASLYGARVLCIDMDQQGNLTQSFNQNADLGPVMIDHIVEGYPILETIIPVQDGIDLIPSRIENAMLDEALRARNAQLERIYREPFLSLKAYYDVIVVDCPPSLGQSVAAVALSSDRIVSPVTPEKYALSGFMSTYQSVEELRAAYRLSLPLNMVFNKFEPEKRLSQEAMKIIQSNPELHPLLLKNPIRLSDEFNVAAINMGSIFDDISETEAKLDVDLLTKTLLKIGQPARVPHFSEWLEMHT